VPIGRVCGDVAPGPFELCLVAEDSIVVVALPDGDAWSPSSLVDSPRRKGFEGTDDLWQTVPTGWRIDLYQFDHAVDVVGHDDEGVKAYVSVVLRKIFPATGNRQAGGTQKNHPVRNLPQEALSAFGTDRDEIDINPAVVLLRKSNRLPVMSIRVKTHTYLPNVPVGEKNI
jgi:hypothetical protein